MSSRRHVISWVWLVLAGFWLGEALACEVRPATGSALTRLQDIMATGRFVAYQPTSSQIINGQQTRANPSSVEADLKILRSHFDGLITYGSSNGLDQVADVAARLGYRALIMGIWDIDNAQEVAAALAAAKRHPSLVVGLSLGNERVYAQETTFTHEVQVLERVRKQAPQLLLTTTEPFHIFLEAPDAPIYVASDFLLVNVHPVFQPWFRNAPDANAAEFVVNVVDKLADIACGPILVKETGVPTAPANKGFTLERQRSFYLALQQRFKPSQQRAFAYFSAFDAPWRVNDVNPVKGVFPEEAHWGLYDENRISKPVVQILPRLPKTSSP